MTKPDQPKAQPQRTRLPPPRTPRAQGRIGSAPRSKPGPVGVFETQLQGEQRRWFDREVRLLARLAHTERLLGDFVAAQRLERELDSFIAAAAALTEQERG